MGNGLAVPSLLAAPELWRPQGATAHHPPWTAYLPVTSTHYQFFGLGKPCADIDCPDQCCRERVTL